MANEQKPSLELLRDILEQREEIARLKVEQTADLAENWIPRHDLRMREAAALREGFRLGSKWGMEHAGLQSRPSKEDIDGVLQTRPEKTP